MKVFISHSAKTDVGTLIEVLDSEGIEHRGSFEISLGLPFSELLKAEIQSADAVLAIYSESSDNVTFELGMAYAFRKPLLVIVIPPAKLPEAMTPIGQFVFDGKNVGILRIALRGFFNSFRTAPSRETFSLSKKSKSSNLNSAKMQELAARIKALRMNANSQEVERFVSELFDAAGVKSVESSQKSTSRGADFAIWSEDLLGGLPYPLLVEVKSGQFSQERFDQSQKQLLDYIEKLGQGTGLLLYLDRLGRKYSDAKTRLPNLLSFDIEDLVNALMKEDISEVLIRRRNRVVHGLEA